MSCREEYPTQTFSLCLKCNGILTGSYRIDHRIDLNKRENSIWKFREYLPPVRSQNIVSMGEGWTPLINADGFADMAGLSKGRLVCKMESQNPTGSFKDRPASLSVSLAKEWNKHGMILASSGNAAASTSAYCARAGMPCLVLFRDDSSISKFGQIAMYGPSLIRVKDLYKNSDYITRAFDLTQMALPNWHNGFIWAKHNPLLLDALKTISYEIAGSGCSPDYIFVPTAGGDLLFGIYKGYQDLMASGQVNKMPKMVVVQGSGSSPTVDAVEGRKSEVSSETIAAALRSNMLSEHGVEAVKKTDGFGIEVSNNEILEAQYLAAKLDGIFCEVSSAAALAAVKKAVLLDRIKRDEVVCAIITGNGFKDYTSPLTDQSMINYADSPDSIKSVLTKMNLQQT